MLLLLLLLLFFKIIGLLLFIGPGLLLPTNDICNILNLILFQQSIAPVVLFRYSYKCNVLQGTVKGPMLVSVSLVLRKMQLLHPKWCLLRSLDNFLLKICKYFLFGNQISKWHSFEKKNIFDTFLVTREWHKTSYSTYPIQFTYIMYMLPVFSSHMPTDILPSVLFSVTPEGISP